MSELLERIEVYEQPLHEPRKTRFDLQLSFVNNRHHGAYLSNEMSAEAVANSLQVMVDNIRSDIVEGLL